MDESAAGMAIKKFDQQVKEEKARKEEAGP